LLKILSRRTEDNITFNLLKEIIGSYSSVVGKKVGMPIGNLTSQIFANIYLNELDRFVKHQLKPKAYLRYGDDFIFIDDDLQKLQEFRSETIRFLGTELKLQVNPKRDKIMKVMEGLIFLGVQIWPTGRTLVGRNIVRVQSRLTLANASSYRGLVVKHCNSKQKRRFDYEISEKVML